MSGYDPWVKEAVDLSIEDVRGSLSETGYDDPVAYDDFVKRERERLYRNPRLVLTANSLRRELAAGARENILANQSFMLSIWPVLYRETVTTAKLRARLTEIEAMDPRDPGSLSDTELPEVAAQLLKTWGNLEKSIRDANERPVQPSRAKKPEDGPKPERKKPQRKATVTAFVQKYDKVHEAILIGLRAARFHILRNEGTARAREHARLLWFELNDGLAGWSAVWLHKAPTPGQDPDILAAIEQAAADDESYYAEWMEGEAGILGVLPSNGSFAPLVVLGLQHFARAFASQVPQGQTAPLAAPFDTEPPELREYPGPWDAPIGTIAGWLCRAAGFDLRLRPFLKLWLDKTAPPQEDADARESRAVGALATLSAPGEGQWAFDVCGPLNSSGTCLNRLLPRRRYFSGNVLERQKSLEALVAAIKAETIVAPDAITRELFVAAEAQLGTFLLFGKATWPDIIGPGTFDPRDTYIPLDVLSLWLNTLQVARPGMMDDVNFKRQGWTADLITQSVQTQKPKLRENHRLDYWEPDAEAAVPSMAGQGFRVKVVSDFNEHDDLLTPVPDYRPARLRLVRLPLYTTIAVLRQHRVGAQETPATIADLYGMDLTELQNLNPNATFAPRSTAWVWATVPMRAITNKTAFKAYKNRVSSRVRLFLGWFNNNYSLFAPSPFVSSMRLGRLYGATWANEGWPEGHATCASAIGSEYVPPKQDILDPQGQVVRKRHARWVLGEMALICSVSGGGWSDDQQRKDLAALFPDIPVPLLHNRMMALKKKITATRADARRDSYAAMFTKRLTEWLERTGNESHQSAVVESYNLKWKSYRTPEYDADPITRSLVRAAEDHKPPSLAWQDGDPLPRGTIVPYPFQNSGARRLVDQGGGLLAFDVGVGKTLTACLAMAKARQEGKARRCVITVPNGITAKWARDIRSVLPDYRVEVIGQHYVAPTERHLKSNRDLSQQQANAYRALFPARYRDARAAWQAELLRDVRVGEVLHIDGVSYRIKSILRTTRDAGELQLRALLESAGYDADSAFNIVDGQGTSWVFVPSAPGWVLVNLATKQRQRAADVERLAGTSPTHAAAPSLRVKIPVRSSFLPEKAKPGETPRQRTVFLYRDRLLGASGAKQDEEIRRVAQLLAAEEADALTLKGTAYFTEGNPHARVTALSSGNRIVDRLAVPKPDPVSDPDKPGQRAMKWRDFSRGRYDVVIVPHKTFTDNLALDRPAVKEHIFHSPAMLRAVETEMTKQGKNSVTSVDPATGASVSIALNRGVELTQLLDRVVGGMDRATRLKLAADLPVPIHDSAATVYSSGTRMTFRDSQGKLVNHYPFTTKFVWVEGAWAPTGVAKVSRVSGIHVYTKTTTPQTGGSDKVYPGFLPNPLSAQSALVRANMVHGGSLSARAVVSLRVLVESTDSMDRSAPQLYDTRPTFVKYGDEIMAVSGYGTSSGNHYIDVIRFPWGFQGASDVHKKRIGTGDGKAKTFHFVLPKAPVVPGHVTVGWGSGKTEKKWTDDGNGNLPGGGHIDYATGVGTFVAPETPPGKRGRQRGAGITVWYNQRVQGTPGNAPIPKGETLRGIEGIEVPAGLTLEQYAVSIEKELNDPQAPFRIEAAEAWINKRLEGSRQAVDPTAKELYEHVLLMAQRIRVVDRMGATVVLPDELVVSLAALGVPTPAAAVPQFYFDRSGRDWRSFVHNGWRGAAEFYGVAFATNVGQRYPDGVQMEFQFKGAALLKARQEGSKARNGAYIPLLHPTDDVVIQATRPGQKEANAQVHGVPYANADQPTDAEIGLGAMLGTKKPLHADQRAVYAEFAAGILADILDNPAKATPGRLGPAFTTEFHQQMNDLRAAFLGPFAVEVERVLNEKKQRVLANVPNYAARTAPRFSHTGATKRAGYMAKIPKPADSLPGGAEIVWDKLGCDFLVVDEVHKFKNLYLPASRGSLGGGKVEFLDLNQASKAAWKLEFLCAAVRAAGGRVVTLTATPATTSPIEFYNVMSYVGPPGRPHETVFTPVGIRDPEEFISRYVEIKDDIVSKPGGDPQEVKAAKRIKNPAEFNLIFRRFANRRTVEDSPNLRGRRVAGGARGAWLTVDAGQHYNNRSDDGRMIGVFRPIDGADTLANVSPGDRFRLQGASQVFDARVDHLEEGVIVTEQPFPKEQTPEDTGGWVVYTGSRVPIAQPTKRVLVGLGEEQFDRYVGYQQHMGRGTAQGIGSILDKMIRVSAHPGLEILAGKLGASGMLEAPPEDEDAAAIKSRETKSEARRYNTAAAMALPRKMGPVGAEFDAAKLTPLNTPATENTQLAQTVTQDVEELVQPDGKTPKVVKRKEILRLDALRERTLPIEHLTISGTEIDHVPLVPAPIDTSSPRRFAVGLPTPVFHADPNMIRDTGRMRLEIVLAFRPGTQARNKDGSVRKGWVGPPWVVFWRTAMVAADVQRLITDERVEYAKEIEGGQDAVHPYYTVNGVLADRCFPGAGAMFDPSLDDAAKANVLRAVTVEAMRRIVRRRDYYRANAIRWGIPEDVLLEAEASPFVPDTAPLAGAPVLQPIGGP